MGVAGGDEGATMALRHECQEHGMFTFKFQLQI